MGDAYGAHFLAVRVVVVGAVAEHLVWALAWPAATAPHRGYRVDQRFEFGDVVAVAAAVAAHTAASRYEYQQVEYTSCFQ